MSDKNKRFVNKSREMYLKRLNLQKQVLVILKKKNGNTSKNTEITFYGGFGSMTNTYASRSEAMYNAYLSK